MGIGYKPRPGVPKEVREAATAMGKLGGGKATDLQRAAAGRNIKKAKHLEKYTYDNKIYCILGVINPKKCLMPDVVAKKPKDYHDKYFKVKWVNPKGKIVKYSARFRYSDEGRRKLEIDKQGFIHVQNYVTRSYVPKKRRHEK